MKNILFVPFLIITVLSCSAKKAEKEPETLPKDIALKPENNFNQQIEREKLSGLIKEIDSLVATENCSDPSEWRSSPIGAKPCGGPSSYIAYPIKMEDEILAKIKTFTTMQADFNKKYQLMSDCAVVPPPAGITCEGGKAVLVKSSFGEADVQ